MATISCTAYLLLHLALLGQLLLRDLLLPLLLHLLLVLIDLLLLHVLLLPQHLPLQVQLVLLLCLRRRLRARALPFLCVVRLSLHSFLLCNQSPFLFLSLRLARLPIQRFLLCTPRALVTRRHRRRRATLSL
jgi:hypothetical protein